MTHILALWLPNWPVQRLIRVKPELEQQAVIIHHSAHRGQSVAACSRAAWQLGVRIGMPLAEATALSNQHHGLGKPAYQKTRFHIATYDSLEDRQRLEELAVWCHQFSPLVGLAEEDPVETLLLDVTGIAPLFGGEQALNRQIETAFLQQHLTVRIGSGDTVGAAWALAHYFSARNEPREVPAIQALSDRSPPEPRGVCADLLELPVGALRLPAGMVETLTRLGLERIGDLLPLPRSELKARFGAVLLQRLDQVFGRQPEIISQIHAASEFAVEWIFEHPIARQRIIQQVIRQLLERLCVMLLKQNRGSLQLGYRLACQDSAAVVFEVGCYRPSADAEHLWKLTEMQLERLVLREPVTSISLGSSRHDRLSRRQKDLFDNDSRRRDSPLVTALIDRLAGRLGRPAIVRCVLQSDPQPEKAFRYEPLVGGRSRGRKHNRLPFAPLDRPVQLLAEPVALARVAVLPNGAPSQFQYDGEQYVVSRHWGPERIETGWWRQRGVRRDYYRVETAQGFRFWMFRCLQKQGWFLHGGFE